MKSLVPDTAVAREGAGPKCAFAFPTQWPCALANNIDRARETVVSAMSGLKPGDEAALFAFDSGFHRLVDFTEDLDLIRRVKLVGQPWGLTSLYDSIAAAAKELGSRSNIHRAVLVLTDGLDSGSRLTPNQVSGIASSIDVPVYVLVMATPVDRANLEADRNSPKPRIDNPAVTLADLARWTGGDTRVTSGNATSLKVRIACGLPSSRISKSAAVSPDTGVPSAL